MWVMCRWIGNAAEDGIMATVFARLKVPAPDGSGAIDDQGVHAFIVPLRDPETKQSLPGVEVHDNAYKATPIFRPTRLEEYVRVCI
jgi:acyl-CoA oxidase